MWWRRCQCSKDAKNKVPFDAAESDLSRFASVVSYGLPRYHVLVALSGS